MLYAYLDETGQQGGDWVFIAGFLGNKEQWEDLAERWTHTLGEVQREHLHMTDLRWSKDSTRRLLAALGPIPYDCGLRHVVSGVNVSHYRDLVAGSDVEKVMKGYPLCVQSTVWAITRVLPGDERVEICFESQDQYAARTNEILSTLIDAGSQGRLPLHMTSDGKPKLAKWSFVPKRSTILLEPADYLAYALTQFYRDKTSKKSQWCKPIIVGDPINEGTDYLSIGKVFSREEIRATLIATEKETARVQGGWGWGLNVSPEQLIDIRRLHLMADTQNPRRLTVGHILSELGQFRLRERQRSRKSTLIAFSLK